MRSAVVDDYLVQWYSLPPPKWSLVFSSLDWKKISLQGKKNMKIKNSLIKKLKWNETAMKWNFKIREMKWDFNLKGRVK